MKDTYPQAVFFLRNDRDAIDRLILPLFGARGRHPRMAGARGSRPVIPYFAPQQVPAGYRASVKKRGTTVVLQIGAAAAQHTPTQPPVPGWVVVISNRCVSSS